MERRDQRRVIHKADETELSHRLLAVIYAAHGCGVYIRLLAQAELFGIFHLFALFLEEFSYTARVQPALAAVERK